MLLKLLTFQTMHDLNEQSAITQDSSAEADDLISSPHLTSHMLTNTHSLSALSLFEVILFDKLWINKQLSKTAERVGEICTSYVIKGKVPLLSQSPLQAYLLFFVL